MFKSNAHREDLEMICSYAKVYMNKAIVYILNLRKFRSSSVRLHVGA